MAYCIALLLILISFVSNGCESSTGPEKIWRRDNEYIWFVSPDHVTIRLKYRIKEYAYLTILDDRVFRADTTRSVQFISAIGDTEYVRPYDISTMIAHHLEDGGTSIYLSNSIEPIINNRILEVGTSTSEIIANYQSVYLQSTISVTATTYPR